MDWQWLIDTTGKVGPASVALAVLVTTRAQNRWNIRIARRSAAVEDQKVRLALLERRLKIIDAFNNFRDYWDMLEIIDSDALTKFSGAINEADLIFPTAAEQLRSCHECIFAFTRSMRKVFDARRRGDDLAQEQALQASSGRRKELENSLYRTREVLIATARVDDVAPLPPPSPFLMTPARWLRRR